MNYILCGFKNSGKTSVGKLLAKQLNYIFIDCDDVIQEFSLTQYQVALQPREIVTQHGEAEFRALEKQAIKSLEYANNSVIATGGGSIVDSDNAAVIKKLGKVIYLHVDEAVLKSRTLISPLPAFLTGEDPELKFSKLHEFRLPLYKQIADIEIDATDKTVAEILVEIMDHINTLSGAQHGK